jgi:hypothetical protein
LRRTEVSGVDKHARRTVVEVRDDLHRELRQLALLNDLRIYEVVNAVFEEFLRNDDKVKGLVRKLRVQSPRG